MLLDKIQPEMKAKVDELIKRCADRGVEMLPSDGLRDPFEQARIWRQSRSTKIINQKIASLESEGALFLAYCLKSVGPQHGKHVTNALPGYSWHQWGEAVDCSWIVNEQGEGSATREINGVNGYHVYAEEAKSLNLTAGGHWENFKDWPHVQLKNEDNASNEKTLKEINDEMQSRFKDHPEAANFNGGVLSWDEAHEQIKNKVIAATSVRNYIWGNRGPAPIGYLKGMALTYAKSYYELRTNQDTAVQTVSQSLGTANVDALVHYELTPQSNVEVLRAVYTLAIGLGMRESSGNTTVGWDRSKLNNGIENTEMNAEAGLFQVSWDSINRTPWLRKLYEEYQSVPENCLLSVFMEGVLDKNDPAVGTGEGAKFQTFTKECPSFAAEYVVVMLRVNRGHFGPITSKKAEYSQDVENLLKEIEQIVNRLPQYE